MGNFVASDAGCGMLNLQNCGIGSGKVPIKRGDPVTMVCL